MPCIFMIVSWSRSGACTCQLLGSISIPGRSQLRTETAPSMRRSEKGHGFLWLSGLRAELAAVMCLPCSNQPKKLNLSIWNTSELREKKCMILPAFVKRPVKKKKKKVGSGVFWMCLGGLFFFFLSFSKTSSLMCVCLLQELVFA